MAELIQVGFSDSITLSLTNESIESFVRLSGDNAIYHLSDEAAQQLGYKKRLVHGALVISYISRFVGTILPGDQCILQRVDISFPNPCYAPTEICISGVVDHIVPSVKSVVVSIDVINSEGIQVARGRTTHSIVTRDGE